MESSETKIAFKNIYITFIISIVSLIISFVTNYLINQFAGVASFGLFSIGLSFIPYVTLFLTSIDVISIYRLYKPLAKKNYDLANKLMSRSLYEYRTRSVVSFLGLLVISFIFPVIFQSTSVYDGVLNGLVILFGGISSMFIFIFSPIYQKVLIVERRGYLLQIFDLIGNVIFSSILIAVVITNSMYNYFDNIKWIIIISIFTKNLSTSFGVFIAFHLRKKICPWFAGKMQKKEVGDAKTRRTIILDTFLTLFVTNTSYFALTIYSNFDINATFLAGVYGNYFMVKGSVSAILGILINSPSSSFARLYNNLEKREVKRILNIYDYFSFLVALSAFFIILIISPFFVSFNTSSSAPQVIGTNIMPTFNIWIAFLVGLSCYIEIARIPCENFKNIKGEYSWKLKFNIFEVIINVAFTIIGIILSYYFVWLNGYGVIASLIIANILATGFRYLALKISVIKNYYEQKILLKIIIEFLFVFILGLFFSLIINSIIPSNIFIDLSWNTVLFFFIIGIITLFIIFLLLSILFWFNKDFRFFAFSKFKVLVQSLKKVKKIG